MERIPQGVARRIVLKAYSYTDHITPVTGRVIAVYRSKNGGAFDYVGDYNGYDNYPPQIGLGWYYADLSASDTDTLGPLVIRCTASGIDPIELVLQVVDPHNAGFDALPSVASGGTGSVPVISAAGNVPCDVKLIKTIDADTALSARVDASTLAGKFAGITLLAKWFMGLARKDAMDATAKTELNAGGGTYDEATDSVQAIRDTAPLGTAMVVVNDVANGVWSNTTRTLTGSALAVGPTAARSQSDIYYTVPAGGTCGLYARVLGWDGDDLTQAGVSTITYSIYALSDTDEDTRTQVDGHAAAALTKTDVLWDTVQSDAWASDWNFKMIPSIATNAAFADVGTTYLVEVTITPTSGQKIIVRFIVKAE